MNENFHELPPHIEEILDNHEELRNEIKTIADESKDPHFENFDFDLLKKDDLEIYEKFKSGILTEKEFENWRKEGEELPVEPTETEKEFLTKRATTKGNFRGYLANKIISWKEYRKFYDNGGKILERYPDGRPKGWLAGKITDEKGKTKVVHPLGVNKKSVFEFVDSDGKTRYANPDKEVKKDSVIWTNTVPEEGRSFKFLEEENK